MRYHSKDLRKGRFSCPNQMYLITTVTEPRQPLFTDFYAARHLIGILRESQQQQEALTHAFVVMPDHLHGLMTLCPAQDLSKTVGRVKSLSARYFKQGVIWQPGFHDGAVRAEEDVKGIARYIVANPLRAGLVKHVADYPHWDAEWL